MRKENLETGSKWYKLQMINSYLMIKVKNEYKENYDKLFFF
jgi:hypothetical protein